MTGLLCLLAGGLCLWAEGAFYGHVDEQGFLHESLFLPIGALLVLLGAGLLFCSGVRFIWRRMRRPKE